MVLQFTSALFTRVQPVNVQFTRVWVSRIVADYIQLQPPQASAQIVQFSRARKSNIQFVRVQYQPVLFPGMLPPPPASGFRSMLVVWIGGV